MPISRPIRLSGDVTRVPDEKRASESIARAGAQMQSGEGSPRRGGPGGTTVTIRQRQSERRRRRRRRRRWPRGNNHLVGGKRRQHDGGGDAACKMASAAAAGTVCSAWRPSARPGSPPPPYSAVAIFLVSRPRSESDSGLKARRRRRRVQLIHMHHRFGSRAPPTHRPRPARTRSRPIAPERKTLRESHTTAISSELRGAE